MAVITIQLNQLKEFNTSIPILKSKTLILDDIFANLFYFLIDKS